MSSKKRKCSVLDEMVEMVTNNNIISNDPHRYNLRPRKSKEVDDIQKKQVRTKKSGDHTNKKKSVKRQNKVKKEFWLNPETVEYVIEDINWVSGTGVKNYLQRDPIIDWLELYYPSLVSKYPDLSVSNLSYNNRDFGVSSSSTTKTTPWNHGLNFNDFLQNQGNEFERKVMEFLTVKFGSENIININANRMGGKSKEKFIETVTAIQRGVPIIYSGVLHDPEDEVYGVPDLIVRSDWLKRLMKVSPITTTEEKIPALNLKDYKGLNAKESGESSENNYHYRIVDIKFMTLPLRSDGIHLLNSGSVMAYKGQLYIYNSILAKIQGYDPKVAYLLGRKWKFTTCGETFTGDSCFDRIGAVNFTNVDSQVISMVKSAIEWVRDVRNNGHKWDIIRVPLPREELYPNMSNQSDYPWHEVKQKIAEKIGEITSLWMCGPKHRKIAHEHGVYDWKDETCTIDTVGMTGEKTRNILSKMIDINHQEKDLVRPKIINNNFLGWQQKESLELYVDMETVSDIVCNFDTLPKVDALNLIFMIGVGHINREGEWIFRSFTLKSFTLDEEYRICREFANYVLDLRRQYRIREPKLIHWASAERNFWNDAAERHLMKTYPIDSCYRQETPHYIGKHKLASPESQGVSGEPEPLAENFWSQIDGLWFDLLTIFKDEPIVIQGCLSFSLKDVSTTLYKHDLIKTTWDNRSPCSNGMQAMILASQANQEAIRRKIDLRQIPVMQEIRRYNEVDCKVLSEILSYLRSCHLSKTSKASQGKSKRK